MFVKCNFANKISHKNKYYLVVFQKKINYSFTESKFDAI